MNEDFLFDIDTRVCHRNISSERTQFLEEQKFLEEYAIKKKYILKAYNNREKSTWVSMFPMTPRQFKRFTSMLLNHTKAYLVFAGTRIRSVNDSFTEQWIGIGYDIVWARNSGVPILN